MVPHFGNEIAGGWKIREETRGVSAARAPTLIAAPKSAGYAILNTVAAIINVFPPCESTNEAKIWCSARLDITTGPLWSDPNSQARNPKQIPIPKQTMPKTSGRCGVWDFGFSPLVLVSDFGLRISDFGGRRLVLLARCARPDARWRGLIIRGDGLG
jgi:hypothetical protein